MVYLVIIIVLVGVIYFLLNRPDRDTKIPSTPIPDKTQILSKPKKKKRYELEGVYFNQGDRREAYKETNIGDTVYIKFERSNSNDANALGVFTSSDKLLGYLARGNKNLINSFQVNPKQLATVIEMDKSHNHHLIKIEIL